MPANSAQYQRDYRDRTKRQYKDVSVRLPVGDYRELKAYGQGNGMGIATVLREGALAQIRSGYRQVIASKPQCGSPVCCLCIAA
jgi:hypothetical protein